MCIRDRLEAEQLLRQADQAMYQAKMAGKNRYHVFNIEQDRSVRGHHESLDHIRHALDQQEFVLHYQPKVNMRNGQVIGAEALIRWQHPQQGLLTPSVFLPVIENDPLAVDIGEWVIHTALTQMDLWHTQGLDLPVSVNVGARQLQQPNFVTWMAQTLAQHPHIRPSCLELEILETSALSDMAGVSQVIEACRAMGVMFALDDFGTGYSSLTYLKRLPVTPVSYTHLDVYKRQVLPRYIKGQGAGSLGEDMPLAGLFDKLLAQKGMYAGVQHFLLDREGNFILAGPWQSELESAAVAFRPDLTLSLIHI